ncbi:5687_t:CDS:1, partial [Funneliformis geosporum]
QDVRGRVTNLPRRSDSIVTQKGALTLFEYGIALSIRDNLCLT